MFSLISGFWQYLFAKTELHILILGLDHAGKTVRPDLLRPPRVSGCRCVVFIAFWWCGCQTFLEQMKGIFKKMPGIPPERIPPTIGLNSAPNLTHFETPRDLTHACLCSAHVRETSRQNGRRQVSGHFLGPWWAGASAIISISKLARPANLAGPAQVRMRSIWEKYYAEAHGMIFVIDSADVGRFEEARLAFGKFLVSLHRRSLVGVGNPLTACLLACPPTQMP